MSHLKLRLSALQLDTQLCDRRPTVYKDAAVICDEVRTQFEGRAIVKWIEGKLLNGVIKTVTINRKHGNWIFCVQYESGHEENVHLKEILHGLQLIQAEENSDNGNAVVNKQRTARGMSLKALINEGLIIPGDNTLVISYKFEKVIHRFEGSLTKEGTIIEAVTATEFYSPSGWSIAAKRRVNPKKQADDGRAIFYFLF